MTNSNQTQQIHSPAPVSFPRWREVLRNEPYEPAQMSAYEGEIFAYLKHLKAARQRASVKSAVAYLEGLDQQGQPTDKTRPALRWFFKAAAHQAQAEVDTIAPAPPPPPVQTGQTIQVERGDLGGPPWEQRMVTTLRTRQLKWRTEEAYRGWARRFALWLGDKPVEEASGDDIRRYLEHLAVANKVSASTQRQALNALVFLVRETPGLSRARNHGPRSGRFFRISSRACGQTYPHRPQPPGMPGAVRAAHRCPPAHGPIDVRRGPAPDGALAAPDPGSAI